MNDDVPGVGTYMTEYTCPTSKATVLRTVDWRPSNATELAIAKHLADARIDVVLQKTETQLGQKSADALLLRGGPWEPWEFKTVTEDTINLKGRVQRDIRDARRQTGCVLIY